MTLLLRTATKTFLSLLIGIFAICHFLPLSTHAATSAAVEYLQATKQNQNALAYRSMLFNYYSGKHFEAATQILAQAKTGGYAPLESNSKQLLFQIYLDIGMSNEAKEILKNFSGKDSKRSQLHLSLAKLYYQQSNMDEMFQTLTSSGVHFNTKQTHQKNYLLGHYYLDKKDHALAYKYLNKVTQESPLHPYANFNKAIVLIKNRNLESAKRELQKLLLLKAESKETMIFRDHVALTLGELYLQAGQHKKAQDTFREVRFNSPYATPALLGLGWSHQAEGDTKAALSALLKLNNKNTSTSKFHQNLLLIPRQYETLGASKEALSAYNFARNSYVKELKEIDTLRKIISSDLWLSDLSKNIISSSPNTRLIKSDEIHKQFSANELVVKTAGANRLFHRYASKDFHHRLKQTVQLQALSNYLSLWRDQLPIYAEMIIHHQSQQEILHQRVTQTLSQLANIRNDDVEALKKRLPELDHQWLSLMTLEERHLLVSLHAIKNRLSNSAPLHISSDQQNNLLARIALLKGSLYWKISRDAPLRQEKLKRAVKQLESEKQKLRENKQKILTAHQIMQRKLEPHQTYIADLIGRIDKIQQELQHINIKQKKRLREMALSELQNQQNQLNDSLAIAELSIARMHESAALKRGPK